MKDKKELKRLMTTIEGCRSFILFAVFDGPDEDPVIMTGSEFKNTADRIFLDWHIKGWIEKFDQGLKDKIFQEGEDVQG